MIFLILTFIFVPSILLGKYIFKQWYNHLTLYVLIWYVMISLYELKLLNYIDLNYRAWIAIGGAFLSFLFGSITIYFARSAIYKNKLNFQYQKNEKLIFSDGGKVVKIFIIISSIIGLFAALQNWYVLFKIYGSLSGIFLHGTEIYRLRVSGELHGIIPYISSFSFVGIFLSGLYSGYKNRITMISFLPIFAVILKQLASFSRAGMLFALFLYGSAFFLYRYKNLYKVNTKKINLKLIFSSISILILFLIAAGIIRSTRGTIESFSGASRKLESFRSGFIITPSLYLYLSSDVGVLSKYLEKNFDNKIEFGKITFQPIYNILSKFGFVKRVSYYDKGFFIPMWSNTATYIRYLYHDFGVSGIFIIPYFIAFFTSFFWYKFFEKGNIIYLIILSYLFVLVLFSFLTMYSRQGNWFISLILLLFLTPIIKKIVSKDLTSKKKLQ